MNLQIVSDSKLDARRVVAPETPQRDEHASIVLRDLASRRPCESYVIVFANEKGGVGKSTLAFQSAIALAHRGRRVVAIDCDRRQQTLHQFLEAREGVVRMLRLKLPLPRHAVLEMQSAAMLLQELERVGRQSEYVIIDLPGHDSPLARRAIAMADTVITPVNCSRADLNSLGSMHPVSRKLRRVGAFARSLMELREERVRRRIAAFDWVVAKNRVRRCERRLNATADRHLATMARHMQFRVIDGLTERLTYRELLPFGLSHLDLKFLPRLLPPQRVPHRELMQFLDALKLPALPASRPVAPAPPRTVVLSRTVERYREALKATADVRAAVDWTVAGWLFT